MIILEIPQPKSLIEALPQAIVIEPSIQLKVEEIEKDLKDENLREDFSAAYESFLGDCEKTEIKKIQENSEKVLSSRSKSLRSYQKSSETPQELENPKNIENPEKSSVNPEIHENYENSQSDDNFDPGDFHNHPQSDDESDSEDLIEEFFKKSNPPSKRSRATSKSLPESKNTPSTSKDPQNSSETKPKPRLKPLKSPFQCSFCPKYLFNANDVRRHENTFHNPINKFKCEKCSNGHCRSAINLKAHLRLHKELNEDFDKFHSDKGEGRSNLLIFKLLGKI